MDLSAGKLLVEGLKFLFRVKVAAALWVAALLFLALPSGFRHLDTMRDNHADAVWIALLASSGILVVECICVTVHAAKRHLHSREEIRAQEAEAAVEEAVVKEQKRRLNALTKEQEDILWGFVFADVVIMQLDASKHAVCELVEAGILCSQSPGSDGQFHVWFTLSDTARKHLYGEGINVGGEEGANS